jgi:hypothetical protein
MKKTPLKPAALTAGLMTAALGAEPCSLATLKGEWGIQMSGTRPTMAFDETTQDLFILELRGQILQLHID